MEIIAYGVQADEQPLLRAAFDDRHELRTLAVFLDHDTAPLAAGYPVVCSSVNAERAGSPGSGWTSRRCW
ncbi:hypothetical protein OG294_34980 [Kitasatospora sp. NBC_01302]|nr:hypothetical protein OG294_34980 [Kitasatospora sp. NBC_01302]